MPTDTSSIWPEHSPSRTGADLPGSGHWDVCVVGAGIAGLTTAYFLTRAGQRVLVLEAQEKIVAGETEYTTAHLSSVIDDRFSWVKSICGTDNTKLAHQSHAAAIDAIEQIIQTESIDCDFARVDGYLVPGEKDDPASIDEEAEALKELELPCHRLDSSPVPGLRGPCLRFPNQGQFDPLRYLVGVAKAISSQGGRIVTGARVEKVEGGTPCRITLASGEEYNASAVVLATNTPINNGVRLNTRLAAYHTYALAVEVPAGSVPRALYWDTNDPYHYVRLYSATKPSQGPDILIAGGEDHKTGQANDQDERWRRVESWVRSHIEGVGAVRHRWSGQVFETLDGLAMIGPELGGGENVYIATGDSGMGMTHGTIAGLLLTDLILGRPNPWAKLYSPTRLPVAAARTFVEENANMVAQFADRLTGGDVSDADAVARGAGAVIRRGLAKVALYREPDGTLHEMSAICPHLGCVVRWNGGEGTWDCPCHGSRFSAEGKVLHGPAVTDLQQVGVPART